MALAQAEERRSTGGALCYCLVCFQNLYYVRDLLAALYRENDLFLVHCDPKAPSDLKSYLFALEAFFPNVVLLSPEAYSWAGFSHVSVSFRAMEVALAVAADWRHFIFLSEQHLPLKRPDEIARALPEGRSLFSSVAAKDYFPSARADVLNRFALVYRELPGVGCFPTALRDDGEVHLEQARHSSNWIALHRDHCMILVRRAAEGALRIYESVVHAEELAIPTLLADCLADIENRDSVLVAAPHLTDNHSLVMTESLFLSALETDHLFIRKRTKVLSDNVRKRIDFDPAFYIETFMFCDGKNSRDREERFRYDLMIGEMITQRYRGQASFEALDPVDYQPSPAFHGVVRHHRIPTGVTVRILSEDFQTFKVMIVRDENFPGYFAIPTIVDDCLYSTLRVRMYGLFGNTDILPLDLPTAGFVARETHGACPRLLGSISHCIDRAIMLARPNSH